jgi:hypothetical protein
VTNINIGLLSQDFVWKIEDYHKNNFGCDSQSAVLNANLYRQTNEAGKLLPPVDSQFINSQLATMSVRYPPSDSHSSFLGGDPTQRDLLWVSHSVGRCRLAIPVSHPTTTRYGNGTNPLSNIEKKTHIKLCGGVKISFDGKVTALHRYTASR